MTAHARAVLNDALALTPMEKASLIEELLASFDRQSRDSVDAAWALEAEDRIDAHDRGEISAVSLESVINRINSR